MARPECLIDERTSVEGFSRLHDARLLTCRGHQTAGDGRRTTTSRKQRIGVLPITVKEDPSRAGRIFLRASRNARPKKSPPPLRGGRPQNGASQQTAEGDVRLVTPRRCKLRRHLRRGGACPASYFAGATFMNLATKTDTT